MKQLVLSAFLLLTLSACVTETVSVGADGQSKYDPEGAARARVSLGLTYLNQGDSEQAKYNLEKALSHTPNNPVVYRSLAYYYQVVGEALLAEKAYGEALKLAPQDADTMNNYGTFLCSEGKYEAAEQQFLKAIKVPSYIKVADTYENAGLCALEAGDSEQGEYYLKYALSHNPRKPVALLSMAQLLLTQKDYFTSRVYLLKYQQVTKDSAESLWTWVQLEHQQGRDESAKKFGYKLVSNFPNSHQSQLYLNNEYK